MSCEFCMDGFTPIWAGFDKFYSNMSRLRDKQLILINQWYPSAQTRPGQSKPPSKIFLASRVSFAISDIWGYLLFFIFFAKESLCHFRIYYWSRSQTLTGLEREIVLCGWEGNFIESDDSSDPLLYYELFSLPIDSNSGTSSNCGSFLVEWSLRGRAVALG